MNDYSERLCDPFYPIQGATTTSVEGYNIDWADVTHADACYVAAVIQRALHDNMHPLKYLMDWGFQAFSQVLILYHLVFFPCSQRR